MKMWRCFLAGCLALLILASTSFAWPYTPKPGSLERRQILNALRVPAEKQAKQKIVFYDVTLRVENGWAWTLAIARDQTGKKLPLGDLMTCGLLRKVNGQWEVLHWGVAGDIGVACAAAKKYPAAPKAIFGGVLSGC
jgi:hypothetical protein